MTTTLARALTEAAQALAAAGFEEPRRQARRLFAAALDLSAADMLAHAERQLAAGEHERIAAVLRRLVDREPLSRILGHREFWGLDFALSADTLDPRPDSETIVEAVLDELPDRSAPRSFLDLGTGTGCLLLSLLREFPAAHGVGVDIAEGAVQTARRNAEVLGLAERARFVVGNWGAALSGGFDAIVANPPYIATAAFARLPREVALFDPPRALDGGADGLSAYRVIAGDLARLLRPGGIVACEVGRGRAAAVAGILEAAALSVAACQRDLAGIARCVVARALRPEQKIVGIGAAPV